MLPPMLAATRTLVARVPLGCPAVSNFGEHSPLLARARARRLRRGSRAALALAVLGAALLIAGCGGSSSSGSSIGVGVENKSDEALVKAGEAKAATTPTSGPLATEPKVTPPSGA